MWKPINISYIKAGLNFPLNYEKNLSLEINMYINIEKGKGLGKRINILAITEMYTAYYLVTKMGKEFEKE